MHEDSDDNLFPFLKSPPTEVVYDLRRMNPWWESKPMKVLPKTRRHLVGQIHCRVQGGLAPIVVVRGPRQIGKTTAQMHVIQDLLDRGVEPRRVFRVQFDELETLTGLSQSEPILRLVDWYEKDVLKATLNEAAHASRPCYLFLDEVQNLRDWAAQLKSLVDASTVSVVVTGSSALRIERGRDSLAGRITTIDAGVLTLTEIATFHRLDLGDPFLADNGLEPLTDKAFWLRLAEHGPIKRAERDAAFRWFSQRGGYPLVHEKANESWDKLADQLNETVIKRVIQHDLRVGRQGRKRDAALLEELFRLACRYAGQSPNASTFAREAQRALAANVGPQRVRGYLKFLDETLLLRLVKPLEIRLKRTRGSDKICLADHGLRASWLQEIVPLSPDDLSQSPHLTSLAGRIAESVVGATLLTISGLDLAHQPERSGDPEVDFVMTIGTKRIPMEVKYQRRIDPLADTEGLRAFVEKSVNNAPFAVLVTQNDNVRVDDPRIVCLPLSTLMLLR